MSPLRFSNIIKFWLKRGNNEKMVQGNNYKKALGFHGRLSGNRAGQLNIAQFHSTVSFDVRRSEPELVRPSQPTPNKLKLLSDIDDQALLRFVAPFILYYPSVPDMKDKDPVKVIKNALADALVHYYPWAGRVREQLNHKLAVDCTAEGVVFGEAVADISLEEHGELLLSSSHHLDKFLYSHPMEVIGGPLLTMQVTRLSGGGFILALKFNHVISDAIGVLQFLAAISELARGESVPSVLPVWRRDLLTSRDPLHATPNSHQLHGVNVISPYDGKVAHRVITFGDRDLATLRARIPAGLLPCTSFELIAASIWRSRTIALQYDPSEEVCLAFVINARSKFTPPLPAGYYGNTVNMAKALSPAGKIYDDHTLGYSVEQVKKTKHILMEEYKRSLIRPEILGPQSPLYKPQSYHMSDVSKLGFSNLDFGWGKPVFGGPIGHNFYFTFVLSSRNENGEQVKVVPICLPEDAMDRFVMALDTILKQH